ncbi:hypothetical protein ETAA8_40430 [Anatilimnocola aggregata]|uniref:Phospholipase D-like domain-containing protein n=1 Tax=Anatilimnocola aggregata TaxID=2528021 RepID=A0A517YFC9_9BACT|nr:hypothetical protein ETAA8_40430 [Anatilimnocola aggregata]
MLNHLPRLQNPGSFVVVSVSPPTDYAGLGELHSHIPNNLFVHWGKLAPKEKAKNGAALMHSKVFYARSGQECWLWTGSHNLTGNATQGGNCEAAVLLHGDADAQPFQDAFAHLVACRDQATLYDPDAPPPGDVERANVLVIHAEADDVNGLTFPLRVHLCLNSADFDSLLAPPADVRLFIYPSHSLQSGWVNANPLIALSGYLTGQNLTGRNPTARRAGTDAAWAAANLNIIESGGVLRVTRPGPPGPDVTTQAVLFIDGRASGRECFFSQKPKAIEVPVLGKEYWTEVDPDMARFFSREHVQGNHLLHIPIIGRDQQISVKGDEVREVDMQKLQQEIGSPERLVQLEFDDEDYSSNAKRHPFILRAKYRLR